MRILALVVTVMACGSPDRAPESMGSPEVFEIPAARDAATRRVDADYSTATFAAGAADKAAVLRELLARGPVLIDVDARRPGVVVPRHLANDSELVLRFGYGLKPPIADLEINADHIAGTLLIGGKPVLCVVPWPAVYGAIVEGEQRGVEWRADMPRQSLHPPESAPRP